MKVKADSDVLTLRRLMSGGPAVSVYFNLSGTPEEPDVAVRWNAVLQDLARHGIGPIVRDSLTRRVVSQARRASGKPAVLAIFAAAWETEPTVVELPGARQPDLVVRADLPHVLPLLAWLQERPPFVLALVDRAGAEIEVHPGGTAETVARTITGPVAQILADELIGGRVRVLLLAGDPRALHQVDQDLPGSLRRQVSIRYVPGGRGEDGTWHGLNVEQQLRSWAAEQNRHLLRRIAEGRNANGWVVEGATATMEALSAGRVRVLAVVGDPQDRDLVDTALRAAVLTGAEIRILAPGTPDAPVGGLGALCAFGG